MKTTDFAECLASYLTMYLPGHAGLSLGTITSYRDTFKLILKFAEEKCGIRAERIKLSDFNIDFVGAFLLWLEQERGCSISTRNQRLTAIRAFTKYARSKKPEFLYESQKILDFRGKKKPDSLVSHLTSDCVRDIIAQPNRYDRYGRRDVAMLSLLYDSAARVSEICDLCVRDIRIKKPYAVTLMGKGRKPRAVPLMEETAIVIGKYIDENYLNTPDKADYPLFFNHQRRKLTRAGITYILKKYCNEAREHNPLIPAKISPHVMRHSKAMHLLQAGVNLVYIRDFLGHAQVETTEIYAKTDTEVKRKELEGAQIRIDPDLPDWAKDKSLMAILTGLCGQE